jgi:predicted RNA-binding Zn ribbon-like protein
MEFDLSGDALCLNLINTVLGRKHETPEENLHTYADLLDWGVQAGSITLTHAHVLRAAAAQRPDEAARALDHARNIREALYHIFLPVAQHEVVPAENLAQLNMPLAHAMAHAQISAHEGHYEWGWREDEAALDSVLWAALRDAADLLTTPERLRYVRECGKKTCGWLFLDTTKNHSRRWCDMKTCGNVMKVRRHRERQHSG